VSPKDLPETDEARAIFVLSGALSDAKGGIEGSA
jgi:hypothetical protein